jgi:hypothetical protein
MDWNELKNHRAQLGIGEDALRQIIDLPEGAVIGNMAYSFRNQMLYITVFDPRFDDVYPGTEGPTIQSTQHVVAHCSGGPEHTPDDTHKHIVVKYDWRDTYK